MIIDNAWLQELGDRVGVDQVMDMMVKHFCQSFQCQSEIGDIQEIEMFIHEDKIL